MADQEQDLVDVDPNDPGDGSLPVFRWKQAGRANWGKLDEAIAHVEEARRTGVDLGADLYVYEAASTGLDAAMPPWVRAGGNAAWLKRLRDPAERARCAAEMESTTTEWDNFFSAAGPDGMLLTGFSSRALQPLIGKTLAEVAQRRL